jgi:hypothetical protein
VVPVNALALIITHPGKEHSSGLCLLEDVLNYIRTPVIVLAIVQWVSANSQRPGRAKEHAAMASNAVLFSTPDLAVFSIIIMGVETALVDTDLTLYTALRVSSYQEFRCQIGLHGSSLRFVLEFPVLPGIL